MEEIIGLLLLFLFAVGGSMVLFYGVGYLGLILLAILSNGGKRGRK